MSTTQKRGITFLFFLLFFGCVFGEFARGADQMPLFAPVPPLLDFKVLGKIQSVQIPIEKTTVLTGNWASGDREILSVKDLNIVDYHEGLDFSGAALSSRGDKIVFSVHGGVRDMLGVLELETGMVGKILEVFEGGIREPIWAPNGDFVRVTLVFASGLYGIDIVDVVKGDQPLTNSLMDSFHNKNLETFNARWSDDGNHLFFSSKNIEDKTENEWVIKIDGTGLVRLK